MQDTLKGSYYANPTVDIPDVSPELREQYQEYYRSNICVWTNANTAYSLVFTCYRAEFGGKGCRRSRGSVQEPREVGSVRFLERRSSIEPLSRFVFKVGCELAAACQPFGSVFLVN